MYLAFSTGDGKELTILSEKRIPMAFGSSTTYRVVKELKDNGECGAPTESGNLEGGIRQCHASHLRQNKSSLVHLVSFTIFPKHTTDNMSRT